MTIPALKNSHNISAGALGYLLYCLDYILRPYYFFFQIIPDLTIGNSFMLTVFFICFLIFFFSSSSSSSSSFFLFLFLFSGTSRYRGSFCMPLRPFQPTIRKYMNLFILTFLHILICAPVSICVYICICVGVCVCVYV